MGDKNFFQPFFQTIGEKKHIGIPLASFLQFPFPCNAEGDFKLERKPCDGSFVLIACLSLPPTLLSAIIGNISNYYKRRS
jgi:hypothetical protein